MWQGLVYAQETLDGPGVHMGNAALQVQGWGLQRGLMATLPILQVWHCPTP